MEGRLHLDADNCQCTLKDESGQMGSLDHLGVTICKSIAWHLALLFGSLQSQNSGMLRYS